MRQLRLLGVLAAVISLLLVACASDSESGDDASGSETDNAFVLDEWSIRPADLSHGSVPVTATNIGAETHELILVHGSDPKLLPTKPDGSVDEDAIPAADLVGEIPDVAAGKSATKHFDLAAGGYLAICNVVDEMGMGHDSMGGPGGSGTGGGEMGHVHYELGMVTTFTVS